MEGDMSYSGPVYIEGIGKAGRGVFESRLTWPEGQGFERGRLVEQIF